MNISHLRFVFLYTLYSFFVFNIPLFRDFFGTLNPKTIGDFTFLTVICFAGFFLAFAFYLVVLQTRVLKITAIVLLLLHSSLFYFMMTYNIQIDREMIRNAFSTDTNEVRDLLSFKMFFYIFVFGVLPSGIVFLCRVGRNAKKTLIFAGLSVVLSLVCVASVYIKVATFFRVNRYFGESFIPFNYAVHSGIMAKRAVFPKKDKPDVVIDDLKLNSLDEINIVLVVGETARRKNFGIYGYERDTTPELAKIAHVKRLDGISCGTSTAVSVPCIFEFKEGYQGYLKPIFEAGAFVKWYENNYGGCYGACDGVPTFEVVHKNCEGSCPDGVIFEEFFKDFEAQKEVKKPKLFVLHQNGSHGPLYYKRYPKEFGKFTPECKTASVTECSLSELINAYDNTIFYTDFLLAKMIDVLKKSGKPSVMIYVSDHGESLGEKGMFLHGFPYSIAPREQKEIPYLIWSSFPLKIKEKEEYDHKSVMQSVLHLLKAQTSHSNKDASILE
jgi:lipid A ethanolaminephosphotransferase